MHAFLLGLAFVLGSAALLFLLWIFRRRPWAGPRTRYPVVLVHGIMGFDQINVGGLRQDYFRGIREHLTGLGVEVTCPRLPPLGSVVERARELAVAIRALPGKRVNIIAHSMGGLDARYAISRLGLGSKVASLTTLGTPHRGTPMADLGAAVLGERFGLGSFLSVVGLGVDALFDLTTRRAAVFNEEVPDVPGVRYGSVLAEVPKPEKLLPLLVPSHAYLIQNAGSSDGLVPVRSQEWGKVLFRIEADHWGEIGWSPHFDALAFYEKLLRWLRCQGL